MAGLNITSFFTNIPLGETIFLSGSFADDQIVSNFDQDRTLINFIFIKTFYKQLDGEAMGSPFGPTLARFCVSLITLQSYL